VATRYQAERSTVGNLLSMTMPPILVPDWQRSFSWTTSVVETFWEDLQRFNRQYSGDALKGEEYFLGSVVIVEDGQAHLLLDGQQRLATSAVLLSVIRDYLGKFNRDAATRVSARYLTDFDDAANRTSYKLTLNEYDRDFFQREVLESRDGSYVPPTPTLDSHRLIRTAREFFNGKFSREFESAAAPGDAHNWALRILTLITNHVSVVAVKTNDEDNAANVFETLNDRGIGLSTPDLLRNLLLRRAREDQRDDIVSLWGEILEIGGDTKVKAFLRHYWISHEGDVKTRSLYREIKASILEKEEDSLGFSRRLRDSASTYRDILAGQHVNDECQQVLQDIVGLNAHVLYPAILSGWDHPDGVKFLGLLKALLVTYIRHNVIGKLENSRLESCVFGIARDLRGGSKIEQAVERLREFAPNDEDFTRSFQSAAISRQATARYLLKEIEHWKRDTGEVKVAGPTRVHVEHIYPRTPEAAHRWENHGQMVNRIGNLTLLAKRLNESLRNAPFDKKKPVYEKSDLLLTEELAALEAWGPDDVEARQHKLAELAPQIWIFSVD